MAYDDIHGLTLSEPMPAGKKRKLPRMGMLGVDGNEPVKGVSKKSKRVGHGPGYTINKKSYPRGMSQHSVDFDDGSRPVTTTRRKAFDYDEGDHEYR